MSDDAEQQFMDTAKNGNEAEEELNGAEESTEHPEAEEQEEQSCTVEGEPVAEEPAVVEEGVTQNGAAEGGQINASKGEDDAGYVSVWLF